MGEVQRIDSMYDLQALIAEQQKVVELLAETKEAIIELNKQRVTAKGADVSEFAQAAEGLDKAIKKTNASTELTVKENARLQQSIKAVNDLINARFASEAKLATLETDYNKRTIANRVEIQKTNRELKLQAQAEGAVIGSRERAKAQISVLTAQKDKLNLVNAEEKKQYDELVVKLERYENFLKRTGSAAEKQRINIGNYGPSVKASLSVLEEELSKVNNQLATTDKDSKAFGVLTKQADLLKTVVAGLNKGFSGTKQELRALQEATKKVGGEFGIASDQFRKLAEVTGGRLDELKDLQAAINFQSSDTKNLDAIVGGIQAVVSAYGAYEAATVLLGEGNEDLQKSMQKLQATLTLVTSVQSLVNALQTDGATIQGILAAKAAFLGAAQKIAAFATGEATVALAAETVAADAAAVAVGTVAAAETAAGVGAAEVAAGAGAAAVAMEAEAGAAVSLEAGLGGVATGEAAVATGASTMATAFAATGIGLLIIAVAFAVYKLVESINEWSAATASTTKANEALAGSIKGLIDATKKYDDLNRASTERQLKQLDNLIAKRKALGVSAGEGLALDKAAADARTKAFTDEVKANEITIESIKKKEIASLISAGNVRAAEEIKNQYIKKTQNEQDANFEETVRIQDLNIKAQQEKYDAAEADYQRDLTLFTTAEDAKQQSELATNNIAKLAADERRKFVLETAKITAEAQIAANDRVLNDEYSSEEMRLSAMKSSAAKRIEIAQAENKAVQSDPTVSTTDKNISAKKTAQDILQINMENQAAVAKLKEDYRLRDLAATAEVSKQIFDVIAKTNEDIYNNEALTEKARLEALNNSIAARRAALNTGFNKDLSSAGISDENIERIKKEGFFEIANKKITDAELLKLVADYNNSVVDLDKGANLARVQIIKDYYEVEEDLRTKALRAIQRDSDLATEDLEDTYNNQLIDLNKLYTQGIYSAQKYNQEKQKLEVASAEASLKQQIDTVEKSLAATVNAGEIEKQLKNELLALNNFTGPQTDDEKKVHDDRIKRIKEELEAIQETVGKETELYKALSKLKKELSNNNKAQADIDKQIALDTFADIKNYADQVTGVIGGIVDAQTIAQKNKLKEQQDAAEQNAAAEIARINASGDTEEKKAARVALVEATLQAQKDQFAQKQKEADLRKARFDKAAAIFGIIINTATAVVKSLPNIPLAILAGVLGAAQLAVAIATPIPKYKHGRGTGKEEIAAVGDGGVSEYIHRADGRIQKTPAVETLTHLMPGDKVYKDKQTMMKELAMGGAPTMFVDANGNLNKGDINELAERIEGAVGAIQLNSTHITKEGWRNYNGRLADYDAWVDKNIKN